MNFLLLCSRQKWFWQEPTERTEPQSLPLESSPYLLIYISWHLHVPLHSLRDSSANKNKRSILLTILRIYIKKYCVKMLTCYITELNYFIYFIINLLVTLLTEHFILTVHF